MNRFYEFNKTRKHRKEVQRIAKEKGYSFPFHDFIKMINILIFGDKIATKLHRTFSSHHDQIVGEVYKYENGKKFICDIFVILKIKLKQLLIGKVQDLQSLKNN